MSERPDRATSFLVVLVILSFALMTLDIRSSGSGATGTLRNGVQSLFTPIQKAATSIVDPAIDMIDGIANVAGLRDANKQLQQRIAELEARLDTVATLEAEVASLRQILSLRPAEESIPKVAARVIARGDSFDEGFQIDAGSTQGVLVGNPVVDDTGALVGTITEVTGESATVVPIVSPSSDGVRVKSQTGEFGIVRGRGAGQLDFEVLDATQPVFSGYLLVTAGSVRYPVGIKVAKVDADAGPEAHRIVTTATPLADFAKLDFVVVLQWTFSTEADSSTTTTTTTTPTTTSTTSDGGGGEG
jgi:rod shape-determining protein MreC